MLFDQPQESLWVEPLHDYRCSSEEANTHVKAERRCMIQWRWRQVDRVRTHPAHLTTEKIEQGWSCSQGLILECLLHTLWPPSGPRGIEHVISSDFVRYGHCRHFLKVGIPSLPTGHRGA